MRKTTRKSLTRFRTVLNSSLPNGAQFVLAAALMGLLFDSSSAQQPDRATETSTTTDPVWTDTSETFKIQAKFIRLADGAVTLQRTDNEKRITVELNQLDPSSRALAVRFQEQNDSESNSKSETEIPIAKNLKIAAKLKWSKKIQFKDGKALPPSLDLIVEATGESARQAIRIGYYNLEQLTADTNAKLELAKPITKFFDLSKRFTPVEKRGDGFFAKHPVDGVRVTFTILNPSKPVNQIESAKGSFQMITGGKRSTLTVKNALLNLGDINSPELKQLNLKGSVDRAGLDSLQVKLMGPDLSPVFHVDVLTPDGKKIREHNGSSWAGSSTNRTYTFSFDRSPPADSSVWIYIAEGASPVQVPFEFKNLPIPKISDFRF